MAGERSKGSGREAERGWGQHVCTHPDAVVKTSLPTPRCWMSSMWYRGMNHGPSSVLGTSHLPETHHGDAMAPGGCTIPSPLGSRLPTIEGREWYGVRFAFVHETRRRRLRHETRADIRGKTRSAVVSKFSTFSKFSRMAKRHLSVA
jgi:hypothetical protein